MFGKNLRRMCSFICNVFGIRCNVLKWSRLKYVQVHSFPFEDDSPTGDTLRTYNIRLFYGLLMMVYGIWIQWLYGHFPSCILTCNTILLFGDRIGPRLQSCFFEDSLLYLRIWLQFVFNHSVNKYRVVSVSLEEASLKAEPSLSSKRSSELNFNTYIGKSP